MLGDHATTPNKTNKKQMARPCPLLLLLVALTWCASWGLRVGVVALSQTSHVLSTLGVAQELGRRGHTVTFLSFEDNRKHATNVTFASVGTKPHPAAHYGHCQELPGLLREVNDYSIAALPALASRTPDVLLIDCVYVVAWTLCQRVRCVCLVANDVGLVLPGHNHDLQPALISGLAPSQLRRSVVARAMNVLQTRFLRYAFPVLMSVLTREYWRVAEGRWLPPPLFGSPFGTEYPMLSNAAYSVVQSNRHGPLVQFTGPWLPRVSPGLTEDVRAFVDSGPFVFVSIGTNAEWVCSEAAVFARALAQLPMRVLWSVKPEQAAQCGLISALQQTPSVRTVAFVDQLAVLAHPNVRVFVSHCGFSSLQEAVFYRVPIAAYAAMLDSDQPTNAALAVDRGFGRLIARPLNETAIVETITSLASDEVVRERLAHAAAIMKAQGGARRAADVVELVALDAVPDMRVGATAAWDVYAICAVTFWVVWRITAWCCPCCRRRSRTSGTKTTKTA